MKAIDYQRTFDVIPHSTIGPYVVAQCVRPDGAPLDRHWVVLRDGSVQHIGSYTNPVSAERQAREWAEVTR